MNLPPDFVRNIVHSYPAQGERFLTGLPSLLEEAACRWDLTIDEPFLLSYNYVCAAKTAGGEDVVLKIGVPNSELTSEIEALRLYDGCGAARLIASDAEKGLLLEQRLKPGTMLLEVADDAQATEIAARVMRSLWRTPPSTVHPPNFAELRTMEGAGGIFIRLEDWFDDLKKLRQRFDGGSGPIPGKLLETAEGLVADFFAENEAPVVLHGDFHHYNVLKDGDIWKVIDPKGVIGPRGYEVGPFLINPYGDLPHHPDAKQIVERRFAILAEQLGMQRSRIRGWGIAHAVLSACWDLNEDGSGGESAIHCAELFMQVRT